MLHSRCMQNPFREPFEARAIRTCFANCSYLSADHLTRYKDVLGFISFTLRNEGVAEQTNIHCKGADISLALPNRVVLDINVPEKGPICMRATLDSEQLLIYGGVDGFKGNCVRFFGIGQMFEYLVCASRHGIAPLQPQQTTAAESRLREQESWSPSWN